LEKTLEIQRGLRESSHAVAQANVQVIAEKDAEILSLTQKLNDATRELMSIVAYVQNKGETVKDEKKEASVESLEEMLEAQRARIAELEEQLNGKDADVRAAEVVAAEVADRCSHKEKEIEELKAEVQKVVSEVVKVTASADELGQSFHTQLAKAQEDVAAREAEIDVLRASFQQLELTPAVEDKETGSNSAHEQLVAELSQANSTIVKLEEDITRMRDALAAMETDAENDRAKFREEKEELSKLLTQTQEESQQEVAALLVKLQLANEMREMKVHFFPFCSLVDPINFIIRLLLQFLRHRNRFVMPRSKQTPCRLPIGVFPANKGNTSILRSSGLTFMQ
jgi:chromosome segregation ATPase